MNKNRLFSVLSLIGVLSFVLFGAAACSDEMDYPVVTDASSPEIKQPSYPELAPIPPPKPMFEQEPILENPMTTLWRPGYWAWDGMNFSWVPGAVMAKPAPTAVWFGDQWIWHTYGWAFVPGYWQ